MKEKDNTGVLFRVTDKLSDKHPDMTGKVKVNNKDMNIAGWINTSKDGSKKYMSLKFSDYRPKVDKANTNVTPEPQFEEEIPF